MASAAPATRAPPPLPPAPASSGVACTALERLQEDCRRGHLSSVREEVGDNKALVNQPGNLEYTALHWAAQTGHSDVVELLLHSGANPNAVNHQGDTPLHLAVWKAHPDVVRILLREEWKTNVDIKNHDGKRAEDLARSDVVREAFAKPAAETITFMKEDDDDDDE